MIDLVDAYHFGGLDLELEISKFLLALNAVRGPAYLSLYLIYII
jgi:hypothetical protein